jgi:hypothetical protein
MTRPTFAARLLGHPGHDRGCDAALEVVDEYVEAQAAGDDADARFPDVAAHLRDCAACREDTAGLRAAIDGPAGM